MSKVAVLAEIVNVAALIEPKFRRSIRPDDPQIELVAQTRAV